MKEPLTDEEKTQLRTALHFLGLWPIQDDVIAWIDSRRASQPPLSRTAMAIAALVGGAGFYGSIPKEKLAPMLYMADVLGREYLGHPITDIEWTPDMIPKVAEAAVIGLGTRVDGLDWLGGLLDDHGNLVLTRIPYPEGSTVTIATAENGDGECREIADSLPYQSVTTGLREALARAVGREPKELDPAPIVDRS